MNWRPIEELSPEGRKVVALISNAGPNGYVTDPWTGWAEGDGRFARWPHPFPPTHFCEIPPLKPTDDLDGLGYENGGPVPDGPK